MSVLLCLLLWSLVEVHSQTEFPYVSFMGETLPNHAFVNFSLVGDDYDDPGSTVRCHTDLSTCCRREQGIHRGDWYFPNGTRLGLNLYGGDISEAREAQRENYYHWLHHLLPAARWRTEALTDCWGY